MYACRTVSRDFKWLLLFCFLIVFASYAYFAAEWVQEAAHATILIAELHLVSCTKAKCLDWKFPPVRY